MKMNLDAIRGAVQAGEITAISIDTSIFDGKQRGLEWGLLKRVQQFKDSKVAFLLSEVVSRELEVHMQKDAAEAQAALRKSLASLGTSWALPKATRDQVLTQCFGATSASDIAKRRLFDYLEGTGAQTLAAEKHVSMSELVQRYFDYRPPFADKETKKHEFPDAISVLSLESWAAEHKTKMLVVTNDGDWAAYCAESDRLVAVDDLAAALGCFQEQEATYFCGEIAQRILDGDPLHVLAAVTEAARAREDMVDVTVDADSQFRCEEDTWEVSFRSVTIEKSDWEPMLEPVEYDGERLVARSRIAILADITVHFSFEKWDGIDKEYLPMGSGKATSRETLTAEVLITFTGIFPNDLAIEDIEVGQIDAHVEFTDLEPDWMNDPENFD